GASASFTIVDTANSSLVDGDTVTNTTKITADRETVDDDDTATVVTNVTVPDLELTKTGPSTVQPGGTLTYTVTATNSGDATATNVVITDDTPAGTTFTSETQNTGAAFACTNPVVGGTGATTCTGTLAAGASASFTIVDTANSNLVDGNTVTN